MNTYRLNVCIGATEPDITAVFLRQNHNSVHRFSCTWTGVALLFVPAISFFTKLYSKSLQDGLSWPEFDNY